MDALIRLGETTKRYASTLLWTTSAWRWRRVRLWR